MKNAILDNSNVFPLCTNPDGFPLVATLFAGSYGAGADYLTHDLRVHSPGRAGGTYRDVRDTDRVFDTSGKLYPVTEQFMEASR